MENQKRVVCPENEGLALYMWRRRQEMAEQPKGLPENHELTLYKAYSGVCNCKTSISTLKDFSQIKGVGKWILKLMEGYFQAESGNIENEDLTKKGRKPKGNKRYVPQKNSVAYALLVCLYRGTKNGNEFMRKQELIDAAEASGLSRVPVMPEKGKGKLGIGSSSREWYSGWNCMKTLITKGLVVKSSCPAKYMLSQEGKEAARECLNRSGLEDPIDTFVDVEGPSKIGAEKVSHAYCSDLDRVVAFPSSNVFGVDVPQESLERFTRMGYPKEQVASAFAEVSEISPNKEISSLWPAVMCRLREDEVYGVPSGAENLRKNCCATDSMPFIGHANAVRNENAQIDSACNVRDVPIMHVADSARSSLRPCSSYDNHHVQNSLLGGLDGSMNLLSMPPLSCGERFEDVYDIVLILDDREHFTSQGSRCKKIVESIHTQFKIKIEVRRLPVGDAIWIARHKQLESEYVLDFIVERKKIDDLRSSIRDNRYRDQKLRLLRCGLKKLIYVVEGDPNTSEAAESIKTACFTTEILEGFDLLRTSGLGDTLRKYGYLTQAITQYYQSHIPEIEFKGNGICPHYDGFVKNCQDLDKMTVSDVFAIQLMQAPQVTEEVALAVLDLYPTLLSLARAYSLLDGDVCAQEEMLRKQNSMVNAVASRNIFKLVWGD